MVDLAVGNSRGPDMTPGAEVPDLNTAAIQSEASNLREQLTPNFSYSIQSQNLEQWSGAEPTMNQYRLQGQEAYPELHGRHASEVIGRIEFLRENMTAGVTSDDRLQAQTKLADAFNISTVGKSDSQIQSEIERAYENLRQEVLDAGSGRTQEGIDRREAQIDRLELQIEKDEFALENGAGNNRRVYNIINNRIIENRHRLDQLQEQTESGTPTLAERTARSTAQENIINLLEERGRQSLPGGIDVEALFAGSRAAQREVDAGGGARRYAREEYIQHTAEVRVERQQTERTQGPRIIRPDETTPMTGPGVENPEPQSTGSVYRDHTVAGRNARVAEQVRQATTGVEREITEIQERGERYRSALEANGKADFAAALTTISQGGDVSRQVAVMDDTRFQSFISEITTALRASGQTPDPALVALEQQVLPIYRERVQRDVAHSAVEDAKALFQTNDNGVRAGLVAGMTDERLQAVYARIEQESNVPAFQNDTRLAMLKTQIGMALEQRASGSVSFETASTPTPSTEAPTPENSPRLLASNLWNALNRGGSIESQVENLSPEQRRDLLTQVERAQENPRYQNDQHLQTMLGLLA